MHKAARLLLSELAGTRSLDEARRVVAKLEKDHGFRWRALADRENNYGSVNIGSDPGYAFVERVTNAIDAVIEREALRRLSGPKNKGAAVPATPREAVETWFKVPGGRVCNLPDIKTRQRLADDVVVRILDGATRKQPTVEVRDRGVGLTPRLLPLTLLSIGASNKIAKPYLAGAYGQGGSTALAFSPFGALFVSRRQPDLLADGDTDLIAVTFARYNPLDPETNKNGRYEYLVKADNDVAGLEPGDLPAFEAGTAVVHFNLEIAQYSERMTQLTKSMWWLLQNALFDPVLPFWAEEQRRVVLGKEQPDRRAIAGNYTRLTDDARDKVEHHDHVEISLNDDGTDIVRANYWVIKASEDGGRDTPITSYVDQHRPVTYTFFGQTHGTDDRRFVSERLALSHLARFLIVQIELDRVTGSARRDLLSTTRDRLKQTSSYFLMQERIREALSEDEELIRLNEERKEALLSKQSEAERAKMRERFAKLMERFHAGIDAEAKGKGAAAEGRPPRPPGPREALKPLPTKDRPTFIRIANTQRPVPIQHERHALLRLESDAPNGYLAAHVHAKLLLVCEPEGVVALESRSDFRGGRSRMTVRPTEKAKPGTGGTLTVYLITPDDKQLSAKVAFAIEKEREDSTSGSSGRAHVQVPDPIPITKDQWGTLRWDADSVAEVKEDGREIKIYVNMDNKHITKLLHGGGYQERGIARMRNNFLLYTAFYSWLQHVSSKGRAVPENVDEFDDYQDAELDRVAQTVVHSISAASRFEDEE
jgi:hypothetical protein